MRTIPLEPLSNGTFRISEPDAKLFCLRAKTYGLPASGCETLIKTQLGKGRLFWDGVGWAVRLQK